MADTHGMIALDGLGAWPATYDPRARWNGWIAAPRFTRAVTLDIIAAWNAASDDPDDMITVTETDGAMSIVEGADYLPEDIGPDPDGLYCPGSYAWCWSEVMDA